MNRRFALGFLLVIGGALVLRVPQLDRRPMHNDEAVNALKFRGLWEQGKYTYDPNEYHGPALAYFTRVSAWLNRAGDFDQFTEATFRIVPVAFGVGLILLLLLLTDGLGRAETLGAAVLTAISPAMVFYSRYYIHEVLLVFFTALALGAGWRYTRTGRVGWCLLAGAGVGLMHATKETSVLAIGAMAGAVVCVAAWSRWIEGHRIELKHGCDLKHIGAAIAVGLLVSVVLFSSFFTNAQGPLDSLRTYLPWLSRAGGNSPHQHAWPFYFHRLFFFHRAHGPIWSEAAILVLAGVGLIAAGTRRGLGNSSVALVR
ncbi:MAG: flippase activity-associated protein Agl23, partial [Limisphaerales bacterium]